MYNFLGSAVHVGIATYYFCIASSHQPLRFQKYHCETLVWSRGVYVFEDIVTSDYDLLTTPPRDIIMSIGPEWTREIFTGVGPSV